MMRNSPFTFRTAEPLSDRHPSQARLMNGYYSAVVTYCGDWFADRAAGTVSLDSVSVECRPLHDDGKPYRWPVPSVEFRDGEPCLMVNITAVPDVMDTSHAVLLAEHLKTATRSAPELMSAVRKLIQKDSATG